LQKTKNDNYALATTSTVVFLVLIVYFLFRVFICFD